MWSPETQSSKVTDVTEPSSEDGDVPRSRPSDVAIVGMACRTAGGNNSPEQLWQFLLDKKDASGEVPRHRWEPWLRRDVRNAKEIEKTLSKGYFIDDLENFDASFFGISPKEAEQMDPHQRLGLELSWEALENAGIDPKSLAGSDTAVYMGVDSDDYSRLLLEDMPNIEAWMGIGTAAHGIPNRISYHLDLMGPSTAVDAACASSLVAVHIGRQAILNGESQVAIVGGVNVLLAPALTRMLGKAGALSPDGICRSFDDAANGYARGEGGAVLVLKNLASAVSDGDDILAVLKGSALAQDGKTNGIMAPNAKAQELVGRQALSRCGVDPLSVGYVEAHATSTPLGDPTEISAIRAVYGAEAGRPLQSPVYMGSIKPNVGHLEAAAGAIGMIKAVLAVKKGQLAPQARLQKLNTKIDWESSGLEVVREAMKWPSSDQPRRAAVCSYGYGGTVSHAVIEQFTDNGEPRRPRASEGQVILTLSASQEKRLGPQAKALASWLSSSSGRVSDLRLVANSLAQRRAQHEFRACIIASDHDQAIAKLQMLSDGHSSDDVIKNRILSSSSPPLWTFSGHGAQWPNMGKELIQMAAFRDSITSLDAIVQAEAGFSAVQALSDGDFDSSERVQILTYVTQIGLSSIMSTMGIRPRAVVGHSVGEIAASVVAGCLTPEEGAVVVTRRARLYARLFQDEPGGMALVNRPYDEVCAELKGRRDLTAAIDSSPSTCVVSGMASAVEQYMADLKAQGVRVFRVKTDMAFHSPMLERISADLREALQDSIHPRAARIPLYSTSSTDARSSAPRDVDYWVYNMVQPVRLRAAVKAAVEDGYRIFLEVSTHPIVSHSVNETLVDGGLDDADFATMSTMRRDAPALSTLTQLVAQLHVSGASVNFESLFGHKSLWCPDVPGTLWMHKPYYKQVEAGPLAEGVGHDVEKHTLLGRRIEVAGTDTVVFSTRLDDKTKPFPGTHPLDGTEIIPAAVYFNTFHHATGAMELSDVKLKVPVAMSEETHNVQIIVQGENIAVASSPIDKAGHDVAAQATHSWVSHSLSKWTAKKAATPSPLDLNAIRQRIGVVLPNSFSIDYLKKIGVEGIAFPWQVLEQHGNTVEMLAKVDMDPAVEVMPWDEHSWAPLLDAATSIGSTIFFNEPKLRIVSQIDRVSFFSSEPLPKVAFLHVEEAADANNLAAHVTVVSEDGTPLAKLTSMRLSDVEGASSISGSVDSLVHQMAWVPSTFSETARPMNHVVMVSPDTKRLEVYANQLRSTVNSLKTCTAAAQFQGSVGGEMACTLKQKGSALVYVPGPVGALDDVADAAEEFIWQTTCLAKWIEERSLSPECQLYVITDSVFAGKTPTALAHGALYGLGRILASEHPDIWGGLIDVEDTQAFPILATKYVRGQDIIRHIDGLPRRAIMKPLRIDQRHPAGAAKTLLPKPEGTYVITGGFGDFGLETCSFLAEKGARRLVVVSRTGLPPRRDWPARASTDAKFAAISNRIRILESMGVTVHAIALDMAADAASEALTEALDRLSLPPVLGIVHAAGILEDSLALQTTRDSFARVLAPKVRGALTLHKAFPPSTVDFFVLYSSIGQLVGTAGQASYGSGNAFLDALATHRRVRGDNAVAFQFTALRGLGMATSTDFLTVELQSKGITDISRDEAFRAWEHLSKYDMDSAVVTRCLPIEDGAAAPLPLLEGVVVRKARAPGAPTGSADAGPSPAETRPTDPAALESWLGIKIRECIAAVLLMPDIEDVDPRTPVADLGVDSVMTVALRQKLQGTLKVKVPPTLTWNHPTVNHLVPWFVEKMKGE